MESREGQWRGRPWLASLLRAGIVGVPVALGWLVARSLTSLVHGSVRGWWSTVTLLTVGIAVSVLVSRISSRFTPLAVLLRMTMIFPDKAPSRLKVARRTTSIRDIQARLTSPRLDEQDAAATMLALVTALGRHDRHTRGHSERVRLFCDLLSRELGLSAADSGRLRWAALVHDIGKLSVPTSILNKPGRLDGREWDIIRLHPDAGALLAAPLKAWLGPWFSGIAEHHERWDGTGYPRGLAASAISPAGRAIAVVDAFETMTASRSYKSARSTLAARAELTRCAGTHFDPSMVRAFLGVALPRLLWSVGPLAFAVNAPFLRWVGEGGSRLGSAVTATTASAANVAGVTAVALAVSTGPANTAPAPHVTPRRTAVASSQRAVTGRPVARPSAEPSAPRPTSEVSTTSASPHQPSSGHREGAPPPKAHRGSTTSKHPSTHVSHGHAAKTKKTHKRRTPPGHASQASWLAAWWAIWRAHHHHRHD